MLTSSDLIEEENSEMPKAINILTILTFIGCAINLLLIFLMKWLGSMVIKVANDPVAMEQMTDARRAKILQSKTMFDLYHQNMIPLLIVTLAGVALCIWGAVKMRHLKKDGFYIYLLGEIAPIIASAVIIGFSVQYNSVTSYIAGLLIPILFIVLYSQQLKRMK